MTVPQTVQPSSSPEAEPRWPAILAILTTCLVYSALPDYLSIGPRWLLMVLVGALELPAILSHHAGYVRLNRFLGFIVSGIMTAFLMFSLYLLIVNLPIHKETPVDLLRSSAILWVSNVMVFALWYWRLDGGGPYRRDRLGAHTEGAFLFPQMTWAPTRGKWSPRFIDYLFLAFNTSTAFSPTDSPVLGRWAKVLVMLQSSISLAVVALLAGRAVNIM